MFTFKFIHDLNNLKIINFVLIFKMIRKVILDFTKIFQKIIAR